MYKNLNKSQQSLTLFLKSLKGKIECHIHMLNFKAKPTADEYIVDQCGKQPTMTKSTHQLIYSSLINTVWLFNLGTAICIKAKV